MFECYINKDVTPKRMSYFQDNIGELKVRRVREINVN